MEAAKNLESTQNHQWFQCYPGQFSDLFGLGQESYCRYLWKKGTSKKGNWQAIGHRQSGKKTTSILDFKTQARKWIKARAGEFCSVDVFFTPNCFFDWRKVEQLSSLHANWLEIDTKNHEVLSLAEEQKILHEVLNKLSEQGIPMPTAYICSGSGGIHLYWLYEETKAFKWRVNVWREMARVLVSALKEGGNSWEVDFGASKDPARLMRLPGTFHGGSGRIVNSFIGGQFYSFNGLARELGVPSECPKHLLLMRSGSGVKPSENKVAEAKGSNLSENPEADLGREGKTDTNTIKVALSSQGAEDYSNRHTIGQWWFKVYTNVVKHSRLSGVREGKRDSTLFIIYIALKHIKKDEESAFKTALELNKEFILLPAEEAERYLSTARKTHYKYRKDSLADFLEGQLGMDSAFLYTNTPVKLSNEEIKTRQSQGASLTAKSKREKTIEAITCAAKELAAKGLTVTKEAIAKFAERSVRTVRRYWSEIHKVLAISSPSIYSPPVEVASACESVEVASACESVEVASACESVEVAWSCSKTLPVALSDRASSREAGKVVSVKCLHGGAKRRGSASPGSS